MTNVLKTMPTNITQSTKELSLEPVTGEPEMPEREVKSEQQTDQRLPVDSDSTFKEAVKQKFGVKPRLIWNPDPVAYIVAALILATTSAGLWVYYQSNSRTLDLHREELNSGAIQLAALVASVDEEHSAVVKDVNGKELPERDLENSARMQASELGNLGLPFSKNAAPELSVPELSSEPFESDTEVFGVSAVDRQQNPSRPTAENRVDEMDDLRSFIDHQAAQIDFLAAENHELRLLIEFGSNNSANFTSAGLKTGTEQLHEVHSVLPTRKPGGDSPVHELPKQVLPVVEILTENRISLNAERELPNESVLMAEPDNAEQIATLLDNGYSSYASGELMEATAFYRQVLSLDPVNRDANLGLAALSILAGDQARATSIYRQLLIEDPDDQTVFAAFLQLADTGNNIEQELLTHVGQLPDVSAALHAAVGNYYSSRQQWSLAWRSYLKSVAKEPAADVVFNLAVSLEHLGRRSEAALRYRQALEIGGDIGFDRQSVARRLLDISSD